MRYARRRFESGNAARPPFIADLQGVPWFTGTLLLLLCCVSCGRDAQRAKQTQAAMENGAVLTNTDEYATPISGAQQSSDVELNEPAEDERGSSTRTHPGAKNSSSQQQRFVTGEAVTTTVAPITTSSGKEWGEDIRRDMDPAHDGWDSELAAEQANKQLKRLGKLMIHGHATPEELAELLSTDFSCTALRPAERKQVYADELLTVDRPLQYMPDVHHGASGFAEALDELADALDNATDKHFKFKLFRLTPSNPWIETTSYFEISGRTLSESMQRSATWTCRWEPGKQDDQPRLLSVKVDDYEEVVVGTDQPLFSDCTESVFRETSVYDQQFRQGIDYWRARIENYLGIYFDGLRGLALGDANGDGLDDIYVCEPGGLPNRLMLQNADGSVRDVSGQSGVDLLDSTRCALFVDLDNDGDQDLVMPVERQIQFYSNNGQGRFERKANLALAGQTAFSLAAADYDQDGKLDVYACFYHGHGEDENDRRPAPIPYHDARTGGFNRLLHNQGNWQFRDVTEAAGLAHNNDRWSFAAAWEDYDNDGDLDLYVANDFGRNNLYRQQQGKFTDVAGPAGAEDMNFGMSVAFGDYDRDGWMDIYVSNMFSAAGGRITFQQGFQPESTGTIRAAYQQMVDGNSLLHNAGDGTFRDVSLAAGVGVGRWAWGSLFADVNNDGWEDLLVANGFMTGSLPGDL